MSVETWKCAKKMNNDSVIAHYTQCRVIYYVWTSIIAKKINEKASGKYKGYIFISIKDKKIY